MCFLSTTSDNETTQNVDVYWGRTIQYRPNRDFIATLGLMLVRVGGGGGGYRLQSMPAFISWIRYHSICTRILLHCGVILCCVHEVSACELLC